MLADYIIAQRAVDKCRAVLAGTGGDYHSGCPEDELYLNFTGIAYDTFRDFVATGAADVGSSEWIEKTAKQRPRIEIIRRNNEYRTQRV